MVSAFNLSATFFVVCVLRSGFANPTAPTSIGVASTQDPFTAQLQESFKNFTQASEWILYRSQQIVNTAVEDGIENVATWALDLLMRGELFIIADGSHYTFPLSSNAEVEQEYKTTAIAVSKLVRNLKTMERADALLTDIVEKWVQDHEKRTMLTSYKSSEKMLRTGLHLYFESIDHEFSEHPELGAEYKVQYTAAKEVVKQNSKMDEPIYKWWLTPPVVARPEEMVSFLRNKVTFAQAIANKLFLRHSAKNLLMVFSQKYHKRYLFARALLQEAAPEPFDAKINEIYQRALVRGGEAGFEGSFEHVSNELFIAIEKGLESEPKLKEKIQLSAKQIDKTTVYSTDMVHIDFSLV